MYTVYAYELREYARLYVKSLPSLFVQETDAFFCSLYFIYYDWDVILINTFSFLLFSSFFSKVMLTDNGIPQLSSTTRIVVTVDDINDHSPEFDQKFYKVQIPVNAKVDQALFQVSIAIYSVCTFFANRHCTVVHFSIYFVFLSLFGYYIFPYIPLK